MAKSSIRALWTTIAICLLASCAQLQWVAERAQGLTLHSIDRTAIEIAKDTTCDSQPSTLSELHSILPPRRETRITRGKQSALPWVLLLEKGFGDLPEGEQIAKLQHEARHYCQRRTYPCFDQLWLHGYCDEIGRAPRSDFRAAFEIQAYQGIVQDTFVVDYMLSDIHPDSISEIVDAARR